MPYKLPPPVSEVTLYLIRVLCDSRLHTDCCFVANELVLETIEVTLLQLAPKLRRNVQFVYFEMGGPDNLDEGRFQAGRVVHRHNQAGIVDDFEDEEVAKANGLILQEAAPTAVDSVCHVVASEDLHRPFPLAT
ncbi:hypothetical protein M758_2G123300 [Ceratodon purpureus]|nr:hypothetical protein M758_2G123300 [Ceratodon purpureus]